MEVKLGNKPRGSFSALLSLLALSGMRLRTSGLNKVKHHVGKAEMIVYVYRLPPSPRRSSILAAFSAWHFAGDHHVVLGVV
jgi:hypothetical protein